MISDFKSGESLPKSIILSERARIRQLFESGNWLQGSSVDLIYMRSEDHKVLFAVSRKIRQSVTRNRIKRRLREIYRRHLLTIRCERYTIGIIGKHKVSHAPFPFVEGDLLNHFSLLSKL